MFRSNVRTSRASEMNVRHGLACATFVLAASGAAMSHAQGLTESDLDKALEIEAKASATDKQMVARGGVGLGLPSLASTFAGLKGKTVRPLVAPVETASPSGSDLVARGTALGGDGQLAVVMRYDYATGVTTRTTVDIGTGKALDRRKDVNYPTPLAKEELDQAISLARQKVSEFDAIIKAARPEELSISHLSPLDNNPSSATYGHRLVYLWVQRPARSEQILVDLSTNEIVADHH
jgi:hypothetical protein